MSRSSGEPLTPSLPGQASIKHATTATLKSSSVVARRAAVNAALQAVSAASIPALPLAEEAEDLAVETRLIAAAGLSLPAARLAPAAGLASLQDTEAASILTMGRPAAAGTSLDQETMATAMPWIDWTLQCLALMTDSTCVPCHLRAAAVP